MCALDWHVYRAGRTIIRTKSNKVLCEALIQVKRVNGCVAILFHPETFLVARDTWTFFQDIVDWCQDAGADLSGQLPAFAH